MFIFTHSFILWHPIAKEFLSYLHKYFLSLNLFSNLSFIFSILSLQFILVMLPLNGSKPYVINNLGLFIIHTFQNILDLSRLDSNWFSLNKRDFCFFIVLKVLWLFLWNRSWIQRLRHASQLILDILIFIWRRFEASDLRALGFFSGGTLS